MSDLANIQDEFGGIDSNILSLVLALDNLGFITIGSCEGHHDRNGSTPFPYILINGNTGDKNSLGRIKELIDKFYSKYKIKDNYKISILKTKKGFYYLYCGDDSFRNWRKMIARRVIAKRNKGSVGNIGKITTKEELRRKDLLPKYHKEIELFAKFLNKK